MILSQTYVRSAHAESQGRGFGAAGWGRGISAVEYASTITQHWTLSRRGLVLTGRPADIALVVQELELPTDAVIIVSPVHATLALWGDALDRFTAKMQDS